MGRKSCGKQRILKLLLDGVKMTTQDASVLCFISGREARYIFKQLHEGNEVRIGEWSRSAGFGPWMPVYVLGKGVDAMRPAWLTDAEKSKRYQARIKSDLDKRDLMLDRRRTKVRRIKADPVAQNLFRWMYEPAKTIQSDEREVA